MYLHYNVIFKLELMNYENSDNFELEYNKNRRE